MALPFGDIMTYQQINGMAVHDAKSPGTRPKKYFMIFGSLKVVY